MTENSPEIIVTAGPDETYEDGTTVAGHLADLVGSRNAATQSVARWFSWEHLEGVGIRATAVSCAMLATDMLESLPDSPELTAGLRKLLEAKDCFVRATIADGRARAQAGQ